MEGEVVTCSAFHYSALSLEDSTRNGRKRRKKASSSATQLDRLPCHQAARFEGTASVAGIWTDQLGRIPREGMRSRPAQNEEGDLDRLSDTNQLSHSSR